ncbi:ATP-dependent DNA helicase [Caerostris darwini]|uniref:ATP-dependent DNA helicase n=1 Tax=Caerostris darwini TaxID=1538125 RepID=A0AAV4R608_9ARAC|nr:ATP-dependent DNA helicase [Caerostris darwini]
MKLTFVKRAAIIFVIPNLAANYGFRYPEQHSCLSELNDLEERLVALRIPFMQIQELGRHMVSRDPLRTFLTTCTNRSTVFLAIKPNGVCIYAKKDIDLQGARAFPNYETGVHVAVVYLKNNIRFAVLYAKPGSTVDEILDAVEEAVGDECDEYQTILAGDFNINMSTEDGRTFCEVLRDVYWLHLRTNSSQWMTRGRTSIDAVFSTHDLKCCGVYERTFSYHVPLYGRL